MIRDFRDLPGLINLILIEKDAIYFDVPNATMDKDIGGLGLLINCVSVNDVISMERDDSHV